jgi:serine/threonine-protein kinase
MGVIRAAEQVALGRTVAIKTLRPGRRDPSAALDLLREAWVTGSLEHPNVVPVHYLGLDDDGLPLIVLKRIEGVEWRALLADAAEVARRFGATDLVAWNLGILMQVLNAVRFAHSRGIVHRDLKPSNVMIGDFGEVYLLDWGIAVSLRDDGTGRLPLATHASQLAGTPCYMAPEMLGRADHPPLSERTDVYLAGAVLFELIAGRPPHAGSDPVAVIASIIASRPELPTGAPAELARICERAMHEDPAQRFESAEALRLAVQGYLEHRGSMQLAERAQERLAALLDALGPAASSASRQREDVYRLFGACRSGFYDALAVWPDNAEARAGMVAATHAVAEYELAADQPDAAVRLLGELPEPPPLLAEARTAAAAQASRRAGLERLGREHDFAIGTRTRWFLIGVIGLVFTTLPLIGGLRPDLRLVTYPEELVFSGSCIALVVGLGWWARESLGATLVNRRLRASTVLVFVLQVTMTLGMWVLGLSVAQSQVLFLFLYAAFTAMLAITVDPMLSPAAIGYVIAFLLSARTIEWTMYAMSAANFVLMVNALWRWWPETVFLSPDERARRRAARRARR